MKTMLKLALSATGLLALTLASSANADGGRIVATTDPVAKAECSACHIAYPAGLMTTQSWKAIMADLPNHFGEDASLDEATRKHIEDYLVANSPRGREVPADQVVLRISEQPWFRGEHGSRLAARAASNPKIGSISNCSACHRGAENGYFDDD